MGVRTACLDPKNEELPYLEVVTLRAGQVGKGVITSDQLYECYTHFVAGRTLPCMEDDCPACASHRPARYEAFVALIWLATKKHQIVRLTKNAVFMAKSALGEAKSPRGYVFELERKTKRANGRLVVSVGSDIIATTRLPESPDLARHLAKIWRIDGMEVEDGDRAYIARLSEFVKAADAAAEVKHAAR